jgi:hypothetical protein
MVSPDKKGRATEGMILAELLKREIVVLVPFGYSQRYDLVIDVSGKLYRLQCKTGRFRKGAVEFNTCSLNNVTRVRKDYRGQVEFFAVYEPITGKIYLVEPDKVGKSVGYLRPEIKNFTSQDQHLMADDFLLDIVLKRL